MTSEGTSSSSSRLSPTATSLSVTASTHAAFDFGRSKRATHGVLEAVGAELDE